MEGLRKQIAANLLLSGGASKGVGRDYLNRKFNFDLFVEDGFVGSGKSVFLLKVGAERPLKSNNL